VARPYLSENGSELKPEIHLYEKVTHKDVWPSAHAQSASGIPSGSYEIDVFQPGFKRFRRDVNVTGERTEVRAVLLVTTEATGQRIELAGRILAAQDYTGMWVLAYPLAGSPSDVTEARVSQDGRFKITAANAALYLVTVMRGDHMLACKSIFIGTDNQEVQISAGAEP
jgi:hypothetical protein